MALIKNEVIFKAKAVDLKSFLEDEGFTFEKESENNYRCKEEHTLLLTYKYGTPIYFWYNEGQKGNIVDYVMANITGNNFRMAIDYLLKDGIDRINITPHYKEKIVVAESTSLDIKYSKEMKHVYAYLCQTRGIKAMIIKELIQKGMLVEDQRHNALFLHRDEEDEVCGADISGTNSNIKFKGVVKGSNPKCGFSLKVGTSSNYKSLRVFEAPIDLISFYQMNKGNLDRVILLSTGGTGKVNTVIETYLSIYKYVDTIYVHTDNDCAGNEAYINIKKQYGKYNVVDGREGLLIANVKDYNELLLKNNEAKGKEE